MKLYFKFLMLFVCMSTQAQNTVDNITYNSKLDQDNVYVELSTTDEPTMMSMLHRGFYVYFDEKGKKKKNVSVQYPLEVKMPQRPDRNERGSDNRDEEKEKIGPNIPLLIEEMPKTAKYINYDSEQEFHLDLNNLGINISYLFNEESKELIYRLSIPRSSIADSGTEFSKLSIGIVTPKMETPNKDQNSNISFGGGGQGRGSGGGRGQRGSGGGQDRGGRGGSQGGPSQQDERPKEVSINIWFSAHM
ncbi:hypothetical protein PXD56_08350 [Maribacter sp. SA7]|uniref:hypothetical protein n=1 Tax=Maribacter zhoushanensis TaxID=3030012 RepID=UPI0023ED8D8C|nr:hypothetical protein [Maribacter zhoushanensis]MDF4202961.1 hypothetical protein [Maribacter zhoushanensis]